MKEVIAIRVGAIHLSELIGKPILDPDGRVVGRLKDVAAMMGGMNSSQDNPSQENNAVAGVFPRITRILALISRPGPPVSGPEPPISGPEQRPLWRLIPTDMVDGLGAHALKIKGPVTNFAPASFPDTGGAAGWGAGLAPGEVLLARYILDRQIVDTHGRKVVRVNDLELAPVGGELRLVAANVGFPSLVRRLLGARLAGLLGKWFSGRMREVLVPWNHVELLQTDLAGVRLMTSRDRLLRLHPADIADILEDLHNPERTAIIGALDPERAAETLEEAEPHVQVAILQNLEEEKAADILEEMSPDDAADALSEMHKEKAEGILSLMEDEEAREVRHLLRYDPDTAGGLMTTEYIAFDENLTVQETIEELRRLAPEAETIYYLYVVDLHGVLIGVLSLRDLIVSKPETRLSEIMIRDVISVPVTASHSDIAEVIQKYDLLAVPVVEHDGRLCGIVTVDDVFDVVMTPPRRKKLRRKT
ncbi:MAG TPA: magnesium transporter [Firmicutes bacterium]|nr:magnesium transporter [Bacillota bacterium]